jgi:WD40 repeat protein
MRPVQALFASIVALLSCAVFSQSVSGPGCSLPLPGAGTVAANIFNDRQEQDLGDALAEYSESNMRLAAPGADDQLTQIGERLLATLPPTHIHYRFRVYDSGEVNGFSLAGGRVYISRKLVAAVKNEDELAGVLAHEIGHLATHQTAIEMTRILRIRLGVTGVTDHADVFAKVHQLLSTPAKSEEEKDTEEKDQLVADHVAVYAMVAAGYAPESFSSFLDESMLNKGQTGNWVSNLFGLTHESAKRYRAARKLIDALPESCRSKQPTKSDLFQAWQKQAVEERLKTAEQDVKDDKPVRLDPPLRASLSRIRFSVDGHYVLAQDEAGISVADRRAQKILFRIEAPDVEAAQFSPDSAKVVFSDSKLRIEEWSLAEKKRIRVKELVVMDGCTQTLLSSDGKTLVCAYVNYHGERAQMGLRLLDTETGQAFCEKANFVEPEDTSPYAYRLYLAAVSDGFFDVMNAAESQDGKYVLVTAGNRQIAFDLQSRTQVQLEGKLKGIHDRIAFLGPDRLFAVGNYKTNGMSETRVFKFPSGEVIQEGEIANQQIGSTAKGGKVIVGPLQDYAVGVYDPIEKKIISASKLSAIDLWEDTLALEDPTGGIAFAQIGSTDSTHLALPLGALPPPRAATFSPDGKFLAVSVKNRAEIWNLDTGKQVRLVRPFRSVWVDGSDRIFGQFPKFLNRDSEAMRLTADPFEAKSLAKLEDEDRQYHDLQYRLKPLGKNKSAREHATLEFKHMETQKVAWSHDYPHEAPACWAADDDRLVLAWDLSNDTARAEIKNYPALQKESIALHNKKRGLLLETVVPETGAPLQQVIVPEADLTGGWNDERHAIVSGNFVLAEGEHGNTAIYRIEDGTKVGEFFGWPLSSDAALGIIAAANREQEILLVDERSGRELQRLTFGSPVRLARIVNGKDKTLVVLTADQVVHRVPLNLN